MDTLPVLPDNTEQTTSCDGKAKKRRTLLEIPVSVECISAVQKGKAFRALDRVKKGALQSNLPKVLSVVFDSQGGMHFSESDKMVYVKG